MIGSTVKCCEDGTILGHFGANPSTVELQACVQSFDRGCWAVLKRAGVLRIKYGKWYTVFVHWNGVRGIPTRAVRS